MAEEEKVAELAAKVEGLESTIKSLESKRAELEKISAETDEAKAKKQSELEALAKEVERVRTDIAAAKEERRKLEAKDKSFQERLREENLEAAKKKIFSEFKLDSDAQAKLLERFKRIDSGAVNQELIYGELLEAYGALNAKSLIETQRKVQKLSEASQDFKAAFSSSASEDSDFGIRKSDDGLTEEDRQAARWAGISIERYKELKAKGAID